MKLSRHNHNRQLPYMLKYKYSAATVAIATIAVAIATFVIRDIQFVDVHYIAHIRQFHYYPPSSFVSFPGAFFTVLFQSCHTPQQLCVGACLFSVPCCFWLRRLYPLFLSFFPRSSRGVSTLSSFPWIRWNEEHKSLQIKSQAFSKENLRR